MAAAAFRRGVGADDDRAEAHEWHEVETHSHPHLWLLKLVSAFRIAGRVVSLRGIVVARVRHFDRVATLRADAPYEPGVRRPWGYR